MGALGERRASPQQKGESVLAVVGSCAAPACSAIGMRDLCGVTACLHPCPYFGRQKRHERGSLLGRSRTVEGLSSPSELPKDPFLGPASGVTALTL